MVRLKTAFAGSSRMRLDLGALLLIAVTFEAALLGSGQLLQIGPLTLKMWLFLACQVYVLYRLSDHSQKLKISTALIVLSFAALLCLAASRGLAQASSLDMIAEDLKPLLYCFMVLFFELAVRTVRDLQLVVRIIQAACILMSVGYIVVLFCVLLGVVSLTTLYGWLNAGDFMFRGKTGLFFYKGSLYIAVGLIFFAFEHHRLAKLASVLAIAGLIATGTRGFFVALGAILLIHIATGVTGLLQKLKYLAILSVAIFLIVIVASGYLPDKAESDYIRIETVHQVVDSITPSSFVLGNGLGVGVPERPVHMEISYLEIFHKQGLLGLIWWAGLIVLLCNRYSKARVKGHRYAQPLFLSAMFVAFESTTNPFINNPIGMSVWAIALVGLGLISENGYSERLSHLPDLALR